MTKDEFRAEVRALQQRPTVRSHYLDLLNDLVREYLNDEDMDSGQPGVRPDTGMVRAGDGDRDRAEHGGSVIPHYACNPECGPDSCDYPLCAEDQEPCPECGTPLRTKWSGVECPSPTCSYWFCY